jgi:hypothetical protein
VHHGLIDLERPLAQRLGRAEPPIAEPARDREVCSGKKVEAVIQSHNGARIMAENAIIRAERAEALAKVAKRTASQPIVLVASPANDDTIDIDKVKKQ